MAEAELLNSKETEMSVLGTIMYDPGVFAHTKSSLVAEDFFFPENAAIFRAMKELSSAGNDINVKSVWNQLYKKGYTGITEEGITDMLTYRVDNAAFSAFVAQLAEFSGYRMLESGLRDVSSKLKKRTSDISTYCSALTSLARSALSKQGGASFSTGTGIAAATATMLDKERNSLAYTGIREIDDKLVDFDGKEISFIAGRPSSGKTSLMLQSARNNLERGARVGFLSMEMSVAKLVLRLLSARAQYNGEHIAKMTSSELRSHEKLSEALDWVSSVPLFIDDTGPFTLPGVLHSVRTLVYNHGVDVVYIDYVGLIKHTGGTMNEKMTDISRELKLISSELDIPLVIGSQLSRDVVKRGGSQRPNLADLRESGSLEQDASIVAFLYPDVEAIGDKMDVDKYMKDQSEVFVKFEIAKQRNGPVFVRDLLFKKPYGTFVLKEDELATY